MARAAAPEARRPGPGAMPAAVLRALDVSMSRRIDGLLAGDYRSTQLGTGTELALIRAYRIGDDVRQIDWNVTARTREPHVRVQLAERVLVTWLVLDVSPSMAFGTADRRKADVAEGVALAVGTVATRRGNRLGVYTFGRGEAKVLPPRQGRLAFLGMLEALRGEQDSLAKGGPELAEALLDVGGLARERSLIVLATDLRGPRDWREPILQLAGRHDVVVAELRDPREERLPDVGNIWVVDPETGRQLRVDTRSARLRERFEQAAAAEREEVATILSGAGVGHIVLSTEGEWLRPFVTFLRIRGGRR